MSSNLRVNNILPSVGTNVAIGTAGGNVTLTGTTNITSGTISGVSTAGITTAYINTLSGISTISASGTVYINQNLAFPSGFGIDFSATTNSLGTMSSEVFKDYEEGTWTPYWSTLDGTNLFVNNDINIWHATYTKIGNICFYSAHFESDTSFSYNTGVTGSTQAYIAGLPFLTQPFALGNSAYSAGFVGYYGGLTGYDAGATSYGFTPMIITEANRTVLRLQYPSANTTAQWTANFLLNAQSNIIVAGFYRVV